MSGQKSQGGVIILRLFQVFSMFSVHPGMLNLPTYVEKTNKVVEWGTGKILHLMIQA